MADINRGKRPLSPHLSIYRVQLTSTTSIVTRITGNTLLVGMLLIVWWLFAAATSQSYYEYANAVMNSWFGKLVMLGSLWAIWYHLLAGLRHLYWDSGRGLKIETAEKLGWAVIFGSIALTILTLLVL